MTRVRRFFLALLLGVMSMVVCKAQTVPSVISEHYTTANGLPSSMVFVVLMVASLLPITNPYKQHQTIHPVRLKVLLKTDWVLYG